MKGDDEKNSSMYVIHLIHVIKTDKRGAKEHACTTIYFFIIFRKDYMNKGPNSKC